MIGRLTGHYRIIEKIGSGGMGEIYLAEDTRLDRKVALKFLPAALAQDPDAKARFVHEAKAASALDHPNVCTVHDIGEAADGRMFMVMPCYEGATLKRILDRGGITEAIPAGNEEAAPLAAQGQLPVADAVAIAGQIAEGLAAAHARGIVHRDLKPANLFVTRDGTVKIIDFGIAKLAGAQTKLTKTGSTVGTAAYMSPEQAMGRDVDARTDIWSLGVILYEMLAGKAPFQGEYQQAVVYSVLNEKPKPLANFRSDLPAGLVDIVARALAKDPGRRYQRISELRDDLKAVSEGTKPLLAEKGSHRRAARRLGRIAWTAGATALALLFALNAGGLRTKLLGPATSTPRAIRLAVLPFANLSHDPQQEYFSDGLTQEMITQLGRLHPQGLSVIARTSVMRYKKGDTPIDRIGRELNVDYVLEGSARNEGRKVKVTAELIQVRDQAQLWSETYEREASGILALQGDVARRVAGTLALKLLPVEQARLANAKLINPDAYEAFLKGLVHWQKSLPADLNTAQHYFELALERDPGFAPAWAELALVWARRGQAGIMLPQEAGAKAMAAAQRAIAIDERCAEAHAALAFVKIEFNWDWTGAEHAYRRALELDPNSVNVHALFGAFLMLLGRHEESLEHSRRAVALDPFNALSHSMYASALYYARRYDEALVEADNALALQPVSPSALGVQQFVYIAKGMRREQLAQQRQRIAADPERVAAFENGLAEGGYQEAQRRIADLLALRYEKAEGVPAHVVERVYMPLAIALRFLDAGDLDRALDWLEKGYEVRDPQMVSLGSKPLFDPLRGNPRFQALLRRLGFPGAEGE